jgi:hypothetical protein
LKLVNVNKLKPCEFFDDEAQIAWGPKPIYWGGCCDVDFKNNEEDNDEKLVYMVQVQHIKKGCKAIEDLYSVKVELDDIHFIWHYMAIGGANFKSWNLKE